LIETNAAKPQRPRRVQALPAGAAVGGITGFLGVGGGFLVVPALIAFAGLGMREAVGTSLLVIAINSAAGRAVSVTKLRRGFAAFVIAAGIAVAASSINGGVADLS